MSNFFMGRDITPISSSAENFNDAKGWIEACSTHSACKSSHDTALPSRILDVGSEGSYESKLLITNGRVGKYVCLSYCWGLSPGIITTYDSLKSHTERILDADLPGTLRDAVHITRALGFRYLWIDALCILQRRPGLNFDHEALADWQTEGSKMHEIYGNAFLTLMATHAIDKGDGCFSCRVPDPFACELYVNNLYTAKLSARTHIPGAFLNKAPIETRAWTFQEEALSQRRLLYGSELSYQCKTSTFWERRAMPPQRWRDGWSGYDPVPLMLSNPLRKFKTFVVTNGDPKPANFNANETTIETLRDHTLAQWYSNLEHRFSGRLLTNEMDILPSLSGVAHQVQTRIGGAYYAGVWEVTLPVGLLWKPGNYLRSSRGKWRARPSQYRAPSWSWAALKGQIYYGICSRQLKIWENEKKDYPSQILDMKTELVGPTFDPMGQVLGGSIKVQGPVKVAFVSSTSSFKMEWTDGNGVVHDIRKENEHLLVGRGEPDRSAASAVGAIANFDTADTHTEDLYCLLLTLKEGLVLSPIDLGRAIFERVGIFKLHQLEWLDDYGKSIVTIV